MSRYRSLPMESARAGLSGKPKVFGEDRVCADPACATKLSRYNSKLYCFVHSSAEPARRTERRQRR